MGYNGADIIFPHLGIVIQNLKNHIMIGGFRVAFYGIIIGCAFLLAMLLVERLAKESGQNTDTYWDFFVYVILAGIIGARLYYVIFNWEYYAQNPIKIFSLREGGLAIYGGIIAVILTLLIFCRVKKQSFLLMIDTLIPGLLLGQMLGRWGNFFNCECFGRYTDTLFAMRIRKELANSSMIDAELESHVILDGGIEYIQVHPAFLYESVWNFASLLFVLWYRKHKKKKDGEIILLYMMLYGTGRFLIEGIRTDSLMIPGTPLRVSQCVSLAAALAGLVLFVLLKRRGTVETVPAAAASEPAEAAKAERRERRERRRRQAGFNTKAEESRSADGPEAEESRSADGPEAEESRSADGPEAEESRSAESPAAEERRSADGPEAEESRSAESPEAEESRSVDGPGAEESRSADGPGAEVSSGAGCPAAEEEKNAEASAAGEEPAEPVPEEGFLADWRKNLKAGLRQDGKPDNGPDI